MLPSHDFIAGSYAMNRYGFAILGLSLGIACTGSSTRPNGTGSFGGGIQPEGTGGGMMGGVPLASGGAAGSGGVAGVGGTTIPDAGIPDTTIGTTDSGAPDLARDIATADRSNKDAISDANSDGFTNAIVDAISEVPVGDAATLALPGQASILEAIRRANTYFTGLHTDHTADIVTDKTRPSNLWTRAIYYEGLMGLYAIEPDLARKTAYYDYAVKWGASPGHPWTMTYTAAETLTDNADHLACGQTYLDLYAIDPQPERIAVLKKNVDAMVAKKNTTAWTWIDAIQMAMPIFARLGVLQSDPAYFDAMWGLYSWTRNTRGGGLFNQADGLWWRDWHFTPGGGTQQKMTSALHNAIPGATTDANILSPNGKKLYWSRGNGWVMAALVRVLDVLPITDPHYAAYLADFKAMAAALVPIQRPDGFWSSSLVDPTHCATLGLPGQDGPETSGTALFAYGLAWGLRKEFLDDRYRPALLAAWHGLVMTALQPDGLLGYVQSTGDRPCTDTTALGATKLANFDDYGVGAFLLAGSELFRLAAP
jgi:rhamnogalacturonyl hydrolase YesR